MSHLTFSRAQTPKSYAMLTLSANEAVTAGKIVPFNTLTTQDGTEKISEHGLLIPAAGIYEASGLLVATSSEALYAELYQNATPVAVSQHGPSASAVSISPTPLVCAAGDVIALYLEGENATLKSGATLGTYLYVKRIA